MTQPLSELKAALMKNFESEFGNLTLGILSGSKYSPVFVNNELEKPRLINWLLSAFKKIESAARVDLTTEQDGYNNGVKDERERILASLKYQMLCNIFYIGDDLPQTGQDKRPKFVLLGTPQQFLDELRALSRSEPKGEYGPPCICGNRGYSFISEHLEGCPCNTTRAASD